MIVKRVFINLIMMGAMAGCVGADIGVSETASGSVVPADTETPRPTMTAILPSPTPTATSLPTNTPTITPTLSPTPSYFVREGTAIPGSGNVITRDNVAQLAELAKLGYGVIRKANFVDDDQLMIVETYSMIYAYTAGTLIEKWRINVPAGISESIISTNQKWVAYATYDGGIHIIRVEDGKEIQQWHLNELFFIQMRFSSDDLMLVSRDNDDFIRIWNISTMEIIMEYEIETHASDVFFTNLDKWVAVSIWNLEYGYEYIFLDLTTLSVLEHIVHPDTMLAFLPNTNFYAGDGQLVEIGSFEKLVDLADLPEDLSFLFGSVSSDISDDKSLLAIGFESTGVGIWRVSDGALVGIYEPEDQVYSSSSKVNEIMPRTGPGKYKTYSVDISSDNKLVSVTNGFGEVFLWDIESGNLITKINGLGYYAEISPNMDTLVSYNGDSLALYNIPTGKRIADIPGGWGVSGLFFTISNKYLANGSRWWNLETGELEHSTFGESIVGLSSDGSTFYTMSSDWRVRQRSTLNLELYNQVELDIQWVYEEYRYDLGRWRISPDNNIIYRSSYFAPLLSWYIEDGSYISENGNIKYQVVGYSADAGFYAIYNEANEEIEVYKNLDGNSELLYSIPFDGTSPTKISLSLETNMIIVISDPFVYIFDFITGDQLFFEEIPHEYDWYSIYAVSFTPDGKLMAVIGSGSFSFYNIENNQLVTTISSDVYAVSSAAFSPDGKLLATVSDGVISLWGIPND